MHELAAQVAQCIIVFLYEHEFKLQNYFYVCELENFMNNFSNSILPQMSNKIERTINNIFIIIITYITIIINTTIVMKIVQCGIKEKPTELITTTS